MKILFIYTNIQGFHEDTYAFGLASLVSLTEQAGHEAKVVIVHKKGDYHQVYDAFKSFTPQIVGFSSVSSQFVFVKELAEQLRKINNQSIIICGGVHPTIWPQCILETDALDAVFVGESEGAFTDFLQKVDENSSYLSCDNIAYNNNGSLVRNPCKPLITDLDILPHPDRETIPFMDTVEQVGYAPFHFSRGCPFPCTYCSNHAIAQAQGHDKNFARFPSPQYCIQEIKTTLKKYPTINKIAIVDDIFGLNKRWRKEFLDLYAKQVNVPFFCLLRADVVNEEFARTLKAAGCYRISFGVESGNDYVRNKIMKRTMNQERIINAFKLCQKYDISTNAINIIGVPGETEEMLWDTINLNREINATSSGVNIFYPYKGTVLGDQCFRENLVSIDKFNDFSNERRETVLNYSEEWCQKLTYYHENWDRLVYPHAYWKRFKLRVGKIPYIAPAIRSILRAIGR